MYGVRAFNSIWVKILISCSNDECIIFVRCKLLFCFWKRLLCQLQDLNISALWYLPYEATSILSFFKQIKRVFYSVSKMLLTVKWGIQKKLVNFHIYLDLVNNVYLHNLHKLSLHNIITSTKFLYIYSEMHKLT